jgi:hypothetical protein
MNSSLVTGYLIASAVHIYFQKKEGEIPKKQYAIRLLLLIILWLIVLFYPQKGNAWCDKCPYIPHTHLDSCIEFYKEQGQRSEELILQITKLTDQYGFNGEDAFMATVGAGMASFVEGGPVASVVSIILANAGVYFCKTSMLHWKTVTLLKELHSRLFYFKKLGEEIVHNRFMCTECGKFYFRLHYMGDRSDLYKVYPPCAFESGGCMPLNSQGD